MPIHCSKCGEALMGAVNRCWQCGQQFDEQCEDGHLPPVRRSPVRSLTPIVFAAELSVGPATEAALRNSSDKLEPAATIRRGSPFADRGTSVLEAAPSDDPIYRLANEPSEEKQDASITHGPQASRGVSGGATASTALVLPLAVISFTAAFLFPLAGVLLALLGIGFGIWGLFSRRRIVAITGLLFCCLSLMTAVFNGSTAIYKSVHGVAPWETNSLFP